MANKHPLKRLGPDKNVWITLKKHKGHGVMGDIRKTRVKEISGDSLLLCQPRKPLTKAQVGRVLNISWLEMSADGQINRRMMDTEFIGIKNYALEGRQVGVLLFGQPAEVYSGSLRRELRVAVPTGERAKAIIKQTSRGESVLLSSYSIEDLSPHGLRFICRKGAYGARGRREDPLSTHMVKDKLRILIRINNKDIMEVEAIIRTKVCSIIEKGEIVHFGVEFSKKVVWDEKDEKEYLQPFSHLDRDGLMPIISRYMSKL